MDLIFFKRIHNDFKFSTILKILEMMNYRLNGHFVEFTDRNAYWLKQNVHSQKRILIETKRLVPGRILIETNSNVHVQYTVLYQLLQSSVDRSWFIKWFRRNWKITMLLTQAVNNELTLILIYLSQKSMVHDKQR